MIFKWAWREIFRGWQMSLFFVFNISLGLTGYISIEAFKGSLQNYLKDNSKQLLSADLSVSARRKLTEKEIVDIRKIVGTQAEETQTLDFFAMIGTAQGSRLVSVKAIDAHYPFYGSLTLEHEGLVTSLSPKSIINNSTAWAYKDLQYQLGLKVGDEIQLGELKLKLADYVVEDSTQAIRSALIAPRIFIHIAQVPKSGLVQYGSTLTQSLLFKLKDDRKSLVLQKQLLKILTDPAIQVDTPQTASEDSGRQLGYLSDFLGLASLVAVFLSGLGIAYIYQLFLSQRLQEIAIYRSLGLSTGQTLGIFILQASFLGALSLIPSLIGAKIFIPILSSLISKVTAFPLQPQMTLSSVAWGIFIALILSLLICLPMILQIRDLKPAQLFREEKDLFQIKDVKWWLYTPSILVFWLLSIYQSNSIKNASLFLGALIGVLVFLFLIGWVSVKSLDLTQKFKDWRFKYSLKSLSRKTSTTLSIFVTLGIGTLLMNLLPQLKTSLREDLSFNTSSPIPSLFFFDIQDDQITPMIHFLKEKNVEFKTISPLVKARILKINDENYERKMESTTLRTREEEVEARMRNRGVNLSYREQLSDSETIVAGRPLAGKAEPTPQAIAELSVEYRFAERMGFKIGDQILFDVQGVSITGRVVNFRRVKWTSFQPNFFILFQDGFLNEAPKTFIGTLAPLKESDKQTLVAEVTQKFANVSMIDVTRLIKNILQIAEQMSWSLELMSALAFLTGFIVLYSIIRSQIRMRRWELNMLKILGADSKSLHYYILNEFVCLSFFSSLFGAVLSLLVSGLMMRFIFDSPVVFSWGWPLASILSVPALAAVICFGASAGVIREKPIVLLRET